MRALGQLIDGLSMGRNSMASFLWGSSYGTVVALAETW